MEHFFAESEYNWLDARYRLDIIFADSLRKTDPLKRTCGVMIIKDGIPLYYAALPVSSAVSTLRAEVEDADYAILIIGNGDYAIISAGSPDYVKKDLSQP